jgi:uncharacterized OsmC-like protein
VQIRALVRSSAAEHRVEVATDGRASTLLVPGRGGGGSATNGGELLCLALATCYCNDLYREAAQRGLAITGVAVEVEAEFGGPGESARRITYTARVESDAPPAAVEALLRATDAVAEVHNTVRAGVPVELRLEVPMPPTPTPAIVPPVP